MEDLKGTRIEFHILQSFPVTCLNRDDVGAPKSAMVGGVQRARVSSQCWKRQVRMSMKALGEQMGVKMGIRTKEIRQMLNEELLKAGASGETADKLSEGMAQALAEKTLLLLTGSEARAMAEFAKKNDFAEDKIFTAKKEKTSKKKAQDSSDENEEGKNDNKRIFSKELKKELGDALDPARDGLDIALFGRMVAQQPDMGMEAASSFSHAISTHRAVNEVEFFTALDDLQAADATGSAHMGSLEYNSATYYRYISLDLGQLAENLNGRDLARAVELFTKALYLAVPSARQNTQAGYRLWDYARVFIRKGQGMQASFDKPVMADEGYLKPSIKALNDELARQEQQAGSLFGKVDSFVFGQAGEAPAGAKAVNIDALAEGLASYVKQFEAKE